MKRSANRNRAILGTLVFCAALTLTVRNFVHSAPLENSVTLDHIGAVSLKTGVSFPPRFHLNFVSNNTEGDTATITYMGTCPLNWQETQAFYRTTYPNSRWKQVDLPQTKDPFSAGDIPTQQKDIRLGIIIYRKAVLHRAGEQNKDGVQSRSDVDIVLTLPSAAVNATGQAVVPVP